jgi:hypothetical protein
MTEKPKRVSISHLPSMCFSELHSMNAAQFFVLPCPHVVTMTGHPIAVLVPYAHFVQMRKAILDGEALPSSVPPPQETP